MSFITKIRIAYLKIRHYIMFKRLNNALTKALEKYTKDVETNTEVTDTQLRAFRSPVKRRIDWIKARGQITQYMRIYTHYEDDDDD